MAAQAEATADKLLKELRAQFHSKNRNLPACKKTLSKLKLQLIHFNLTPPFSSPEATVKKQMHLARETLELGVLVSIEDEDVAAFERYFNQIRVYYTDFRGLLDQSARQWSILGLNLMNLLSQDRISEFHIDLELIELEHQEKPTIKCAVELEQRLMEGSYAKVLRGRKLLPDSHFAFFFDKLAETVREKIADCTERSYENFPVAEMPKLLMLKENEIEEYCAKREWQVKNSSVHFNKQKKKSNEIPSHEVILKTLSYATELERIV